MNTYAEKNPNKKIESVESTVSQIQKRSESTFQFVDNRPEAITQRKLQEMANNSPQVEQATHLKSLADNHSTPLQRYVDVYAEERENDVVITAKGDVSEFKGGNSAKNYGWNNVEKYKADAYIDKVNVATTNGYVDNTYLNAQAGHVLAEQNGGLGSDPDNVFAQDGGMNNSWYRSNFENPMAKALGKSDDDDKVLFRAVLWGDDIYKGKLEKEADDIERSDEDTDFDIDEESQ